MSETSNPHVIQANDENFDAEVFERSTLHPVIVDFWATWCQPCLMLAPILEQLAAEYEGKFTLVKAETSEAPGAAARFNVSSIPALFAVVDGDVVDMLTGGLPEPQMRDWIDNIVAADSLRAAERLESASPEAAAAAYRALLENAADNDAAKIGLARSELALGNPDEATKLLEQLESRGWLEPEAEKVKAALQFANAAPVDLQSLKDAAAANPDDLNAALELASAYAANDQYEEALAEALALVQRDRKGVGENARQLMVDIFRALPDDSELTSDYRRRLSMALF